MTLFFRHAIPPLRACLVACPYWFKESRARRERCRVTVFTSNHTFLPMALLPARTKHAHFAHFELHRVLRGGACRMYALGIACLQTPCVCECGPATAPSIKHIINFQPIRFCKQFGCHTGDEHGGSAAHSENHARRSQSYVLGFL